MTLRYKNVSRKDLRLEPEDSRADRLIVFHNHLILEQEDRTTWIFGINKLHDWGTGRILEQTAVKVAFEIKKLPLSRLV